MKVTFHEAKRAWTLAERGLDFAEAPTVFSGTTLTLEDDRQDYGETRYQTIGRLKGELVMVVWTPRGEATHILSMRKCNDREKAKFEHRLA